MTTTPRQDPRPETALGPSAVELESFIRARRFLESALSLDDLLAAILEEALQTVKGTRGFLGLINPSRGELDFHLRLGQGWETQPVRAIPLTGEPGCGITAQVALTGNPYVTGDVRRDPHYLMVFPDVRSEIAVPLVSLEGRVIGVLNVESERPDAFDHRDLQLLVSLANQSSVAISIASYREREAALVEIGNELAGSTAMEQLLPHVAARAADLLRADDCSVFEMNATGDHLTLMASGTALKARVGTDTYRLGEGLTGWVALHAVPVRVANVREDRRWRGLFPELPEETIESYLAAPVFVRDALWGVLRMLRRRPRNSALRNDFTERDERLLVTLARQVGATITRLQLTESQLRMERMAAWGEMSARSAHMIGNKVFAIKGQLGELQHLARGETIASGDVLRIVERAKSSVTRLEFILREFRDFLMATHIKPEPTDLNELVAGTVEEVLPPGAVVDVRLTPDPTLPRIPVDAQRLRRALSELLENAASHQPDGGAVQVSLSRWDPAADCGSRRSGMPCCPDACAMARIDIRDEGPGVPEAAKAQIFQPFYTTRAQGMGLGLSIVKGIIDAHQGFILEVGKEGEGAHFLILLPMGPGGCEPAKTGDR